MIVCLNLLLIVSLFSDQPYYFFFFAALILSIRFGYGLPAALAIAFAEAFALGASFFGLAFGLG
jgi:hypothetical protein